MKHLNFGGVFNSSLRISYIYLKTRNSMRISIFLKTAQSTKNEDTKNEIIDMREQLKHIKIIYHFIHSTLNTSFRSSSHK
jgi:hypothetical protein